MFSFFSSLELLLICLLGLFSLTAVNTAFRRLHRKNSKKELDAAGKLFFYRYISSFFFPKHEYEDIYFANLFTQNAVRFFYAILAFFFVAQLMNNSDYMSIDNHKIWWIFYLLLFFFTSFYVGDYLGRILGNHYPRQAILFFSSIVSLYMTLTFPFTYIFLHLFHRFPKGYMDPSHEPREDVRQELMQMIEEYTSDSHLDSDDKELLESVMEFKNRIAREIMVPRVAVFALSADTTIEEAAKLLSQEGYSRTPVYKESLDNIIGVLMYKDILKNYMELEQKKDHAIVEQPISKLVKNVLYTPETKKIGQLLKEFRQQQVHLAIIVDEYGGTEGIVTIEDILEQIVGEISDEYDETEAFFIPLPEGGWLVDARMTLFDIEEKLQIEIPQKGDYDTLGGYIFHETGMIPPKGFLLYHPYFEIEVIRSNERRVEKVRIKPTHLTTKPG